MCIYGAGVRSDGMGDWVNTLAYIHGADYCSLLSFGIYNTTVQILRRQEYAQCRVLCSKRGAAYLIGRAECLRCRYLSRKW